MKVSHNPQTDDSAWSFYSALKDSTAQLDSAIQDAGNPDFDPDNNSSQSS